MKKRERRREEEGEWWELQTLQANVTKGRQGEYSTQNTAIVPGKQETVCLILF